MILPFFTAPEECPAHEHFLCSPHILTKGNIMNDQIFKDSLKSCLGKKVPEGYTVEITSVRKNNGVCYDALLLRKPGIPGSPVVYLQPFRNEWERGESMEAIADHILRMEQVRQFQGSEMVSLLTDPARCRKKLVKRLVGYEKNEVFLERIPHRRFLDMAVTYCIWLEGDEDETATVQVSHELLRQWNMSAQELEEEAAKNMSELLPPVFMPMRNFLEGVLGTAEFPGDALPLYVLTNRVKMYGAVWIAESFIQRMIADQLQEDYYVLPSSIHECIILPASFETDEEALADMVREINATAVLPEEVLTGQVYRYDRIEEKLYCPL